MNNQQFAIILRRAGDALENASTAWHLWDAAISEGRDDATVAAAKASYDKYVAIHNELEAIVSELTKTD